MLENRQPDDPRSKVGETQRNREDVKYRVPAAAQLGDDRRHAERHGQLNRHDDRGERDGGP